MCAGDAVPGCIAVRVPVRGAADGGVDVARLAPGVGRRQWASRGARSDAQRRHRHREDAVPPWRRPTQAPGGLPQERDSRPCVDRAQRRRRPVLGGCKSTNLNGPRNPNRTSMCSAKNVSAVPPAT